MRSAGLLIVAALAVSGAGPAQAAGRAQVTLPLRLGDYDAPRCNRPHDGNDRPLSLEKKGYFEDSDQGYVTFVVVTKVGQNRYRIREWFGDEEGPHRNFIWEIWEITSPTSFTVVGGNAHTMSITYRYCGPSSLDALIGKH